VKRLERYFAPRPFDIICCPSVISDSIKISTSWFVVLAEGFKVWANDKVAKTD
jgi:hypothetical protein